ncbi:MAG: ArgE/DapE family deacylase [Thermomicrobiales bacterium]
MNVNPSPATERLWVEIDRQAEAIIQTVADLVRIPSLLGDEAPVQRYVADHLQASGLATESWDLDDAILDQPNAGNSGVPFSDRPNVAGTLAGFGNGRSLILNGHIDVVSPEPVSAWEYDPWGATIVGNRMYGRGAYDMKAGVALNLMLPRLLREAGVQLDGDLIVQSVIEEECTGNGALDMSLRYPADACIVTEPTGGSVTNAHVGVLWFRVAISGVSWHAMQAWKGVNAITKAVPVIQALERLDAALNAQPVHPAFAGIDHPINLNIGVIQGGDWPSTVPGACELHCRLSMYPGQSVAETRAAIERAIHEAALADDWLREHPPVITYDGFGSAGSVVSMDELSMRLLGAWHKRVSGAEMAPRSGTGINDMRYFNFQGIPSACYGPGGALAHAADEWLDLDTLVPTAKTLGAFMIDWCGAQ